MKRSLKIYTTVLFLLFSGILTAQQRLSLEDCRRMALENNKSLKIANQRIESAEAQKKEVFTKYLPAIDASGAYLRNQKEINLLETDALLPVGSLDGNGKFTFRQDQVNQNGQPLNYAYLPKDKMSVDARNVALVQVGLTQPVFMGGKIRAYHEMAGLAEKLSHSAKANEIQEIILATDEAYWQIISLENHQEMLKQYVETMQKLEHDVKLMHSTGIATKADILSVSVKLNEAEMNLVRVEDGLSLSRMALNRICGLPLDSAVLLQEEVLDVTVKPVKSADMENIYRRRPEIASLEYMVGINKKRERIDRADYLPEIAFTANYISMTPSFFDGISTKFDGMWSVGVGIKVPLVHWGASRKNLRHTRARTAIASLELADTKEKIELQVRQSEFKIREVEKKMIMAGKNLEQAEENLKFARLGFQEGTIPIINVMEAHTAWLQARAALIDSQIEARLSEVYLRKAYGQLSVGYKH